jgi:hypothetical protein
LIDLNSSDRRKGSIGREAYGESVKECTCARAEEVSSGFERNEMQKDVVLARGELVQWSRAHARADKQEPKQDSDVRLG